MKPSVKIITAFLGLFLLMPGMVKFSEPFKTMLSLQIEKSGLPFPTLSYIGGHSAEIATGLLLFSLLFFWRKFPTAIANKLFYLGNLMVIPIMSVAIYTPMFQQKFCNLKVNHRFSR